MTLEGFDASYDKPTGAEAIAAGRHCAVLYITDPGPGDKGITQAVWDDYTQAGLSLAFVWELGEEAVLNGRAQGVADAKAAQANLHALNGPSDQRALYFAIDFDIQPADYPKALAYFQGANSVIGENRTGAYGGYDILVYLTAHKVISKRFQTYAWSNGRVISPIDILQYSNNQKLGSGTVDYCRMYSDNWGQKSVIPPAPKPAPKPAPAPAVTYTVKSGDTLSSIGAHYHVSWQAIYAANKSKIGSNPNLLTIGTKLTIPKS